MANWIEVEKKLFDILNADYYRQGFGISSPRDYARKCVQEAQGSALPSYSGEIDVVELTHSAQPRLPRRLVRGFDTTRQYSPFGGWWIDYELFKRFVRATRTLPHSVREQKIKAFMRARSAISLDWNNMCGIAEMNLPVSARTPAILGKVHYQRFITDPTAPNYLSNVFFIGGDLQYYVCVRDNTWIRGISVEAGAA